MILISHAYISRLTSEPFHSDENYWLYASGYFDYLFRNHTERTNQWNNHFLYITPPVGLYIHGLANVMAGDMNKKIAPLLSVTILNDINESYKWKPFNSALPPTFDYFIPARTITALFGIGTLLLFLLITKNIVSLPTATLVTFLFAFHSDMLFSSRKALSSAPTLFFMLASVYFLAKLVNSLCRKSHSGMYFLAILTGATTGLSAATKFNGFVGLPVIAVSLVGTFINRKKRQVKHIMLTFLVLSVAFLSAGVIFILVNPFLYTDTLLKLQKTFTIRADLVTWQQTTVGPALTNIPEKFKFVIRGMLFPTFTHRYTDNAHTYSLPFYGVGVVLGFCLLLFSLAIGKSPIPRTVTFVWMVVVVSATILWIPLAWEGYRLQAVIPSFILFGISIDTGFSLIKKLVKNKRTHSS